LCKSRVDEPTGGNTAEVESILFNLLVEQKQGHLSERMLMNPTEKTQRRLKERFNERIRKETEFYNSG